MTGGFFVCAEMDNGSISFLMGGMAVKLNKNSIFYHCLLLSSSSVVLQLLGFGYRVLLGRLAGAQAIAVYGLVMSAYNVVLSCTLTGAVGFPHRLGVSGAGTGQKYHPLDSHSADPVHRSVLSAGGSVWAESGVFCKPGVGEFTDSAGTAVDCAMLIFDRV